MEALVVYESMFGNTRDVAEAVARGVSTVMAVRMEEVGEATALAEVRAHLLVVGAPTHAFGLSRESTRRDASQRTGRPLVSQRTGVREWLDEARRADVDVAVFDTKVRKPNLPGSAGHRAEKRLRRLGCRPVTPAMTFYVDGMEGPLVPGELDRATAWGREIAELTLAAAPTGATG